MTRSRPRILALEPYAAPSHRSFFESLARHSRYEVLPVFLPPRYWKWRMGTAAMHFAPRVRTGDWDLLLVSDYVNLAELRGLLGAGLAARPCLVYFHENQLTYPLQPDERRDIRFGLDHLYSVLAADRALFNSRYHQAALQDALARLLAQAPDVDLAYALEELDAKSIVLPLGVELEAAAPRRLEGQRAPVILWPHRWEYDKDPEALVALERELVARGVAHHLHLLGQRFRRVPGAFEELRRLLGDAFVDRGFLPRAEYVEELRGADIVLSTARHEFFGLATLEALRSGALPVLPNDLAYPELLPDLEAPGRFLYAPDDGPLETLLRAIDALRVDDWQAERHAIVAHTDRLAWPRLAYAYDRLFEQLLA